MDISIIQSDLRKSILLWVMVATTKRKQLFRCYLHIPRCVLHRSLRHQTCPLLKFDAKRKRQTRLQLGTHFLKDKPVISLRKPRVVLFGISCNECHTYQLQSKKDCPLLESVVNINCQVSDTMDMLRKRKKDFGNPGENHQPNLLTLVALEVVKKRKDA